MIRMLSRPAKNRPGKNPQETGGDGCFRKNGFLIITEKDFARRFAEAAGRTRQPERIGVFS